MIIAMSSIHSRLRDLGPVCCTNTKNNLHSRTPTPMLFSNIPLLWEILELVVHDWQREITPLQDSIDGASDENERLIHTVQAFAALQPHYLKCLFSYVLFFTALENAYDRFYEQLNALNRKSFLRVKHAKKPKPTAYIRKIRRIRNLSIAHVLSKEASAADSAAAIMWQPMTLDGKIGQAHDLNRMTFGAMKLTLRDSTGKVMDHSDDFEVKGILEMDQQCRAYLNAYDRTCADYLSKIHARLPIAIGDEQYFEFKVRVANQ